MKKYFMGLIIMLVISIALTACTNPEKVIYSKNANLTVEVNTSNSDIQIIQSEIITNSEQLEITNKTAEYTITVYLFHDDDTSNIIYQANAKEGQTINFTNLTSAQTYSIGVSVDNLSEEISICCEIKE